MWGDEILSTFSSPCPPWSQRFAEGLPVVDDKDEGRALAHLPADLLAALEADTADLRKQGWNLPPGAAWCHTSSPRALWNDDAASRAS